MLNDNATLVVIATPTTATATTERTNMLNDISVTGVETSFKVLTVLTRFVAVLEIPPVDSAQKAVQVEIVKDVEVKK